MELSASDRVKFLSPDPHTFVLILSRVEESDLAVYECTATNKVSTQSSKAKLIITGLLHLCERSQQICGVIFLEILQIYNSEVSL